MNVLFIISTDDAETAYNSMRLANVAVSHMPAQFTTASPLDALDLRHLHAGKRKLLPSAR